MATDMYEMPQQAVSSRRLNGM